MITKEQKNKIQAVLVERGLLLKPLQDEMIDHIACDIEQMMAEGVAFDQALHQVMGEIPAEHFSTIQRDSLLVIDKRFIATQWLSYLTLGSLFLALLFKVLHLQFSGELLIFSFILIAIGLLTGSISGASMPIKKRGIVNVVAVIAGVIILQLGYAFKILHLPGADNIIILAVAVTFSALLINTYRVFQSKPGKETMLTFLHEKYTPNIERFLMILLSGMVVAKLITLTTDFQIPGEAIILLIIIFGAGLQFIAMTWRIMEQQIAFKKSIFPGTIVVASMCLTLPFLGNILLFEIRVVAITIFTIISAWLAFRMQQHTERIPALIMAAIVPIIFIVWAGLKLHLLPPELQGYFFNPLVLGLLVAGLAFSAKHDTMRAFMILSVGAYLLEYTP